MGSVVARKRGGKTYAYYVYYDNSGRRIEEYCGAEADPESKRKLLRKEMDETEMQIAGLNTKLAKLKAQFGETGRGNPRAPPPPERRESQKAK